MAATAVGAAVEAKKGRCGFYFPFSRGEGDQLQLGQRKMKCKGISNYFHMLAFMVFSILLKDISET